MSRLTKVVVAMMALLVTSCGGDAANEVAAFEDIAVEGPEVSVDPSGTVATLRVETSIEAICAVAYGVGEPSGRISTDSDMERGGHTDHSPLLTGLEPDTEYQYRLQGVGADGQLYRSEVYTFHTPTATQSEFGTNLAVDATVVEASSEFSGDFAAENAFDGDLATEWSTDGDGDDAFIVIDLGVEANVEAVSFRTREMGDGSAITETFTVEVDGEQHGPFPAGPNPVEVTFTARELRFEVNESTGGNTGAVEIEIFGP